MGRDEALHAQRFAHFAAFYQEIRGECYPLEYERQGLISLVDAQRILFLGLNSAWELDHLRGTRAGIHPGALAHALNRIRNDEAYRECMLKVVVWHHPLQSPFEDRIVDVGFLQQLAKADFRLILHGHIHKSDNTIFRYDAAPGGRRLEVICAGTFGAPTTEWVPGYPLQYNLLHFEGTTLTVETRRREELNGAWAPDARWLQGSGKDPSPRYSIQLLP